MPKLTRRRYPERQDCWHIYFGDVRVGTVARRVGQPHDEDPWEWDCSFYPGSEPGEQTRGTAATFEHARADFEVDWKRFSARRTPADYQAWRDARDWTTRKYAMWERGERMPSQIPSSIMPCPCGVRFDSHKPDESYPHRQHIYAKQQSDGIRR
jgi:hypothetical protein